MPSGVGSVKTQARTTENSLVERIKRIAQRPSKARAIHPELRVTIGDDVAIWRPHAGNETLLTCDWFLEGTHFLADRHPANSIGWKCLARAVSDIAAMGGSPRCFLLSLALPSALTEVWLEKFLYGLATCFEGAAMPDRWRRHYPAGQNPYQYNRRRRMPARTCASSLRRSARRRGFRHRSFRPS